MFIMDFIKKIENEIEAKRLNISELSKTLGVSRNTVYNLNEKTAIGTIFNIIKALGMKPIDFFKEEKPKNALTLVHEEAEVYGVTNYKEKYFETLEKLNTANERLLNFTDLKKDIIKKKR